ncbi:MAG: hypothetical protein ACI39H_02165, partial [Lachnospiraceae bacterium]
HIFKGYLTYFQPTTTLRYLVLTLGQLLNYVIVYLIAGQMIMFSYRYVVWPMLVCIPVFAVIAAMIPRIIGKEVIHGSAKSRRKE